MTTAPLNQLRLEPLEPRCLLSGLWQGLDVDGDLVKIKLRGPGEFEVTLTESGIGERIDAITLYDTTDRSRLIINARRHFGGDGFVDVDTIDGVGQELRALNVDGNLGFLDIDSVRNVRAFTTAAVIDDTDANWFIGSDVNNLRLRGHLEFGQIEIAGTLKRAVINGDIYTASLLVDREIRNLRVRGSVAEDSVIFANERIHNVNINGHLDFSSVETNDRLNYLHVGLDVIDAIIFAEDRVNKIIVDGAMIGTTVETFGEIDLVDVWDWIEDTTFMAGSEGIDTIFAYDIENVTFDTVGRVRHLILDVDTADQLNNTTVYTNDPAGSDDSYFFVSFGGDGLFVSLRIDL